MAGLEGGSIVGIGGDVVEELVNGNHCVFGGCSLGQVAFDGHVRGGAVFEGGGMGETGP